MRPDVTGYYWDTGAPELLMDGRWQWRYGHKTGSAGTEGEAIQELRACGSFENKNVTAEGHFYSTTNMIKQRAERWAMIRTDFRNTVWWAIPGKVQESLLLMQGTLRSMFPLTRGVGALENINNFSECTMDMIINVHGIGHVSGILWHAHGTEHYLASAFPDLNLGAQVHLLTKDFTQDELKERLDTCYPEGSHGVTGGSMHIHGHIAQSGWRMTVSDGLAHPAGSGGIYLQKVDITQLVDTLRSEEPSP